MTAENFLSLELESAIRSTLQTKATFASKAVATPPSWQTLNQQPLPATTAGGAGSALGTQIVIAVVSVGIIASAVVGSTVFNRSETKQYDNKNTPAESKPIDSTSSTEAQDTTTSILPPVSYERKYPKQTPVPPSVEGSTTTTSISYNPTWHWLDGEFFGGKFYGLWLKTLTPTNGGETIQTLVAYNYFDQEVLWESPRLNPAGHISIISDAEFDSSELVISGTGEVQSVVAVNFTYHAATEIFSIVP